MGVGGGQPPFWSHFGYFPREAAGRPETLAFQGAPSSQKGFPPLGRAQQSRHMIELRDKIKPSANANRRFLS